MDEAERRDEVNVARNGCLSFILFSCGRLDGAIPPNPNTMNDLTWTRAGEEESGVCENHLPMGFKPRGNGV
jgi:hypothetical protein